jgi:hypothetical protein
VKWVRDPRWPFQEIQGITVVVVPARRELHELDEAAGLIWKHLAAPCDAAGLAGMLCEEYDVTPETAERDVAHFLETLEEKGLVVRA